MMLLFRISVQLSVEHLVAHAYVTPNTPEQLPVYFYSITGVSNLIVSIGQFTLSTHYVIERS